MQRNPMNIRSKQQTLLANAILSKWEKYNYRNKPKNWTISEIKADRRRVNAAMKKFKIGGK